MLRPEEDRCEVSFGSTTAFVRYGVPFGACWTTSWLPMRGWVGVTELDDGLVESKIVWGLGSASGA